MECALSSCIPTGLPIHRSRKYKWKKIVSKIENVEWLFSAQYIKRRFGKALGYVANTTQSP